MRAASPFARRVAVSGRALSALALVAVLTGFAIANIVARASWREVEDGVLWVGHSEGIVAADVAKGSAADRAGVRAGDVLLAIDGRPVSSPGEIVDVLHRGARGTQVQYAVLRLGARDVRQLTLQPVPQGPRGLYFAFAGVAIFTLAVGLSVRLRRPADHASLHFFWMCVAFFGLFAFSPTGRFDRLDWFFYWADEVSLLLLPPLFVHFSLVFPDRPNAWVRSHGGRTLLPLAYLPALLLGGLRVGSLQSARVPRAELTGVFTAFDRIEIACLALGLLAGFTIMLRALRRVRSVTARRQLRWIVWGTSLGAVPFAVAYLLPYAAGAPPVSRSELLAIPLGLVPLAFASAIVRYRLMDVEVIIKRAVVYAAAVAAIAAIYAVSLRLAGVVFFGGSDQHNALIAMLATLVVVLLAQPIKNLIQTTLDRAYYRDRYDYRRALVGFARDLNSDLDLQRLSGRLVARVIETLLLDRMALLLGPPQMDRGGDFTPISAAGFPAHDPPRALPRAGGVGARVAAGHMVAIDDAHGTRKLPPEEVAAWRADGVHYFVPCVAKEGTIAVMALGRRTSGEPLNSEDMALLAAVAGQVATALENGRLYRQLQQKATELDRLREFSESIIESLNDGLVVVDLDDRVVRWNGGLERLHGIPRQDAIGRRLDELFETAFVDALRTARRDEPAGAALLRVPLPSRHPDGSRRLLVNAGTVPLRTLDGATAGTMVILEDITQRVELEEQLQISEKMASIGLLAAGVAHEVNTPLTGISSFTQMLLQGADPEDPRTPLLEKIERQTFRAAKIVNGLLNLSRPAKTDLGPVDLNVVINDVLSLLEHQFRTSRIQVRKELASHAPVVRAIEHKLQQVFLNLLLNARDAMPKGGWLSIRTGIGNGEAVVEVGDTGSGIPSEHLSRIYDPFFTTKAIGQGTGLGLSITYGIVHEHGGAIACNSTVGKGTRFTLTLPLSAEARERPSGAAH